MNSKDGTDGFIKLLTKDQDEQEFHGTEWVDEDDYNFYDFFVLNIVDSSVFSD